MANMSTSKKLNRPIDETALAIARSLKPLIDKAQAGDLTMLTYLLKMAQTEAFDRASDDIATREA